MDYDVKLDKQLSQLTLSDSLEDGESEGGEGGPEFVFKLDESEDLSDSRASTATSEDSGIVSGGRRAGRQRLMTECEEEEEEEVSKEESSKKSGDTKEDSEEEEDEDESSGRQFNGVNL